jgi:dTDP-4-amino-4,6-dideoxygalactose transaminase
MNIRIPLSDLDYGSEEEAAVLSVIRSRWLTMGAVTQEFERRFAERAGVKYAFAVSNCTDALHLAFLSLGIGPGDEVIVPSMTFVASANAVLYTGADVRFADITNILEPTISPDEIEKLITPKTKAICVVHYGGYPCRMTTIQTIARQHNLAVIEDAAHAPGASLEARALGAWGDVGCYSFFSNKNMATGEGGMLVTDREDIAEKVKLYRSHGMTTLTWDRHQGHAHSYDVVELGHNYRIDEIHSALGIAQLEKLSRNNARRKFLTERYFEELNCLAPYGLEIPFAQICGAPSYHIMPVLLPETTNRDDFMNAMRADGIQTSIHYPPIHQFSYHEKKYGRISLPVTEAYAAREVTLPLYPTMSEEDLENVVKSMEKALLHPGPG